MVQPMTKEHLHQKMERKNRRRQKIRIKSKVKEMIAEAINNLNNEQKTMTKAEKDQMEELESENNRLEVTLEESKADEKSVADKTSLSHDQEKDYFNEHR